jgi:membrane fusion protein (multidrug efflux system)
MKKKTILASLLVLAVIWGIHKYRSSSASSQPNAVWVQAIKVQESSLPLQAQAIGSLVARSVEITPEVSGHVREIYFHDGAFVKQDTALIQLDDAIYKAKHESSKAQLSYSENDYKRKSLLGKQGAIAQQAIDQAYADLKEKKANTQESEVMLNKMRLAAPFDGMVGKSKVNLGDYVTTGQSVVTLTDTQHLRIEYNVPEKFLPLLKPGQEVKITAAAYPNKTFIGKVSFISPTISVENRSISLYAEVSNDNNELAPGMFVNVTQSLGSEEKVVMVPARSLVPALDGEQIYKILDGKAYAVTVLTGKRANEYVQVTQGLKPGDFLITDGQLKLRNGMPVQVKS